MAAGGPGDHWRTDLYLHNRPAFGDPADSLIKEIYLLGGEDLLADVAALGRKLWDLWPQWGNVDYAERGRLTDELRQVRDDLRSNVQWDID